MFAEQKVYTHAGETGNKNLYIKKKSSHTVSKDWFYELAGSWNTRVPLNNNNLAAEAQKQIKQ